MNEQEIQLQINDINRKLDILLEEVSLQKQRRIEIEDLVQDVSVIGKDIFETTVRELDKADVELSGECTMRLGLNLIKNIRTFNQVIMMLESAMDFMKDVGPIFHQMGLDAINKMAEFERKGYFEYITEIGNLLDNLTTSYTAADIRNLNQNLDKITTVVRNLTQPGVLEVLEKTTGVIASAKMDDELDDKSLLKLYKEINSKEVRKSLFFALRILKNIVKENNN